MITFNNGGRLVQDVSELPDLRHAKRLYADFETTSGDPDLDSLNPWHHCWAAGIAVTADDAQGAWYIPVGCQYGGNLPLDAVQDWWCDLLDTCGAWVNHHVKYDALVSLNALGVLPECPLVCSVVQAKIVDSDRWHYSLDKLSQDWLGEDIHKYEEAMQPYLLRNKDYGAIPADVIGEYACQDVLTNRRLDRYTQDRMPEQCYRVRDMEIAITSVLFHMERRGFMVDPVELMQRELVSYMRMEQLLEELKQITGRAFQPHVNTDCYDVLCNQYGLPILAWTEGDEEDDEEERGNASFNKHALVAYSVHPDAPPGLVERIQEYRSLNTLCGMFLRPYQKFHIDGVMHSTHNQLVRTGRLSCKQPNSQQCSPIVKSLIHPRPGMAFVAVDDSQAEYRLIANYIQNPRVLEAYSENPDTDFHQHVADVITEIMGFEVKRRPAKTINFLMGYGGGKKKLLRALEGDKDLVGGLPLEARMIRAKAVYDAYHATLPELKRTSRRATDVAASRGYVFNKFGRRRHLPPERSHIAFNTLNQGTAADTMKDRMVRLALVDAMPPDYFMLMQVHDELVLEVPAELAGEVHEETYEKKPTMLQRPRDVTQLHWLQDVMERPGIELSVPWRCSLGISTLNWMKASKTGFPFDRVLVD